MHTAENIIAQLKRVAFPQYLHDEYILLLYSSQYNIALYKRHPLCCAQRLFTIYSSNSVTFQPLKKLFFNVCLTNAIHIFNPRYHCNSMPFRETSKTSPKAISLLSHVASHLLFSFHGVFLFDSYTFTTYLHVHRNPIFIAPLSSKIFVAVLRPSKHPGTVLGFLNLILIQAILHRNSPYHDRSEALFPPS